MTRYLLVLSESEGIVTVGHLPRIGETVIVKKKYGEQREHRGRVARIEYEIAVQDLPVDDKDTRGQQYEFPAVYLEMLS